MRIERTRRLAVVLALLAAGGPACAAIGPWSLGAGISFGHDDNLFRGPTGEEVSDRYTALSLLGGFDQTIGRQHLQANAAVRDNRYEERADLDFRGYDVQLGWTGSTVGAVSWNLSYAANRRLASYGSAQSPELRVANVETSRQASAGVQLGLVAKWVASAAISHRAIEYSAPAYARDTFDLDALSVSLQWNPLGRLAVTAGPRVSRGRYPQARTLEDGSFEADGFDRHDLDLVARWSATGASTLNARLSLSRQRYDLLSDRDFEGATGQLGWQWQPTGKTRFNAVVARDTGSETSFFTLAFLGQSLRGTGDNSQLTTSISAGIDHELTGKVSLGLTAQFNRRRLASSSRLDGQGGPVGSDSRTGTERNGSVALGLRYAPTRNSSLGCDIGHGRRSAVAGLSSAYRVNTFLCSGQLFLR
jgi:hypothetical protein